MILAKRLSFPSILLRLLTPNLAQQLGEKTLHSLTCKCIDQQSLSFLHRLRSPVIFFPRFACPSSATPALPCFSFLGKPHFAGETFHETEWIHNTESRVSFLLLCLSNPAVQMPQGCLHCEASQSVPSADTPLRTALSSALATRMRGYPRLSPVSQGGQ